MFDSTKELLDKIRLGESTFLEFKEVRFAGNRVSGPHRDSLADELAAFANSRGGVFVFGVEDRTRDVVGIRADRLDTVVDYIKEVCATSIDPPIEDLALDRLWLPSGAGEDVAVIKVEIPRSLFVHRSPGGFLHRVADSKRPMSTEYLARMFQQRSQTRLIRFDGQIVEGAGIEDLTPAAFKTMGRVDHPQYDMAAVFEAVANAVAHRDYSVYGSKIRLRLFENRLEIYSPGAIANSLAIDSLRYRQSARNEAVCSLLAKCPAPDEPWLVTDRTNIMDKRGEGVPVILDNSTRLSGKEPRYRLIDDAELLLTIYAATAERAGSV